MKFIGRIIKKIGKLILFGAVVIIVAVILICVLDGRDSKRPSGTDSSSVLTSYTAEETSTAVKTTEAPTAVTSTTAVPESKSGIDPDLKNFLDEYEEFMDGYVEFMKKYSASDDTFSMMADYLEMLNKYAEFSEACEKYDTDDMSDAELAYYLEVTGRIQNKLLEINN